MLSTTIVTIVLLSQTYASHSIECNAINQLVCYARSNSECPTSYARTSAGRVDPDLLRSKTVGKFGPILLEDFELIEALQTANREIPPERIGHAKGAGAKGRFIVTNDCISQYTRAACFQPGVETKVTVRFSNQVGERGSADTFVDARGFAVKFYTTDGILDLVALNLKAFGIRDPKSLPLLLHARKKSPVTHLLDTNRFWDAPSYLPETAMFLLLFFSQANYFKSYSFMDGFAIHTFRLVNKKNEVIFAKFNFLSDAKNKSYFNGTIDALVTGGIYPEYLTEDLYNLIAKRKFPTWTLNVQLMTEAQAKKYKYSIFDSTKFWEEKEFPNIPVGKLILDENPTNYYNDVEQAAFCPSNLIPGVESSQDPLFAGRMFAYKDAQMYRLGVNHNHLPINRCPFNIRNYEINGFMQFGPNGLDGPDYFPNSYHGPTNNDDPDNNEIPYKVCGTVDRYDLRYEDNFSQCQDYVKSLSAEELNILMANMAISFTNVHNDILKRVMDNLMKPISLQFAAGLQKAIDIVNASQ